MALQTLGAGGLGKRELRRRVHGAEMVVQSGSERHLQQVGRAGRRRHDAEQLVER